MTERNDFEELFSSVFEGAEMTPPDSVKEALDAALFAVPVAPKKKRSWWIWSLGLFILLGGGSAWVLTWEGIPSGGEETQFAEETQTPSDANTLNAAANSDNLNKEEAAAQADEMTHSDLPSAERTEGFERNAPGAEKQAASFDSEAQELAENGSDQGRERNNNRTGEPTAGNTGVDQADNATSGNGQPKAIDPVNSIETRRVALFEGPDAGALIAQKPEARISQAPKQNPWMLSAYAGTSFGMNTLRGLPGLTLEEQAGVYASVEALYPIARRWMVSGGVDFTQRVDRFIQNTTISDSLYTGNTVVYVYDSMQTIVDTLITPNYQPTTIQQETAGRVSFYSIGIPLYLHYQVALGNHLSLDLSAGIRCSYMKYTPENPITNIAYPERYSQFGLNVSLRPELLVPINRVQFGVYGRFEYDALHGMQWNAVTRTRWSAGFGLSVRYKF